MEKGGFTILSKVRREGGKSEAIPENKILLYFSPPAANSLSLYTLKSTIFFIRTSLKANLYSLSKVDCDQPNFPSVTRFPVSDYFPHTIFGKINI